MKFARFPEAVGATRKSQLQSSERKIKGGEIKKEWTKRGKERRAIKREEGGSDGTTCAGERIKKACRS